jgi:hypothetical protein
LRNLGRKSWQWLALSALFFFALLALTWWLVGGVAVFQAPTIRDLMGQGIEVHAIDRTAELCAKTPCIEGWSTDVGEFLRFKSSGEAEYFATILGDEARRDGAIVVDFRGLDPTFDQKKQAVDILFSHRDWY